MSLGMAPAPELTTVLSTVAWSPEEINLIRQDLHPAELIHCDVDDHETIRKTLAKAQVAILKSDLPADALDDAPNLVWVHCDHAGLNKTARSEVFARENLTVTSSAGRSAPALAQHAFFFALSLTYDTRSLTSLQAQHEWHGGRETLRLRGAMWGRSLGILGYGHTGREMAALGRAFGMRVTVLRRRRHAENIPDRAVDVFLSTDAGDDVRGLLGCDVIMIAAGLTDETHHLFDADVFRQMKNSAVLINMGRGAIVDEVALVEALKAGDIAGAGLDVFEVEPLPKESPLWDLDNVLITPHSTPGMPDRTTRSVQIVRDNIARFKSRQPMCNMLERRDMYTKEP